MIITPLAKPVKWTVAVPGSKSFMNRAVLCAALARGRTVLVNPVYCDDTNYLLRALQQLGVRIEKKPQQLIVHGSGGKFHTPARSLQIGNAGTTARFLLPFLPAGTTLTGNARMQQRPLTDLIAALHKVGFVLDCATGCPPVTMQKRTIHTTTVTVRATTSSQYVSALLLLAPTLPNGLHIRLAGNLVSAPYVQMTVAVMQAFGVMVQRRGNSFSVRKQSYRPTRYVIEGDASSATYWWALAAISGSHITVTNVAVDTLQPDILFLRYLQRMGCTVRGTTVVGPWPGGLASPLKPIAVNMKSCPDAVISVAVVAALADGVTTITGIKHLAVKESNRAAALQLNLRRLGVSVRRTQTTLRIIGRRQPLWSGKIHTYNDHRLAMAFAILGLVQGGISVTNPDCVKKSYPTFWRDLKAVQRQAKQQNIIVTGMRGAGKTTMGQKLAQQWGCRFIDLDRTIEQKVQVAVSRLITEYGWQRFRAVEHRLFKTIVNREGQIIATGGGTLMDPHNARLVRQHYVVFIQTPLSVIKQRLKQDRTRPPLLSGSQSALAELRTVWQQRQRKYYSLADTIYDSR